jgi:hypothetical protein
MNSGKVIDLASKMFSLLSPLLAVHLGEPPFFVVGSIVYRLTSYEIGHFNTINQ